MARLLLLCLLILGGCGEEPSRGASGGDTRLVVEVRPTGDDPVRRRVVRELPPGVTAADFAPVPAATACAEVYGGPATARIDGTLDGKPVHAAFDRTNACEMARWDRIESLLGPAPTGP
jgi:hypothetical protein